MYCFDRLCCSIGLILYLSCVPQSKSLDNTQTTQTKELFKNVDHLHIALKQAYEKIEDLEFKLSRFETTVSKRYPEVKFLNYLRRKRVLVRNKLLYYNIERDIIVYL